MKDSPSKDAPAVSARASCDTGEGGIAEIVKRIKSNFGTFLKSLQLNMNG